MTSESIPYACSDSDVPARPQFCTFLYTACCAEVALLISLHNQLESVRRCPVRTITVKLHKLLSTSSFSLSLAFKKLLIPHPPPNRGGLAQNGKACHGAALFMEQQGRAG